MPWFQFKQKETKCRRKPLDTTFECASTACIQEMGKKENAIPEKKRRKKISFHD